METVFWYSLGYAALLHGVQVCAATLMSSHYHLVVVDRNGNIPHFAHTLNRMLACATKALRGWPGSVFEAGKLSMVELTCPEAVIAAMGYGKANGVTSFAVRKAEDWPGARTSADDVGTRTIRAEHTGYWCRAPGRRDESGCLGDTGEFWLATADDRPDVQGGWPHAVEFDIEMPDILLDEYKEDDARRRIQARVRREEQAAHAKAKAKGISFAKRRQILRQRHTRRGRSYETFGGRDPQFAAAGNIDAAVAAITRNRVFNAQYERGLTAWRSGDRRKAVFPYGTWKMRVIHNARCRPPP